MSKPKSPLKILLIIPLLIALYIALIEVINFSLQKLKTQIPHLFSPPNINIEFKTLKLYPSLMFTVEYANISNENFNISLSKANFSFDLRKLILEEIPINFISISNVSIQLLEQTSLENQESSQTNINIYKLIQKLKNTKILAQEIKISLGDTELKINEANIKIHKDNNIIFNTKTQIKIGTKKIVRLFHSIVEATGIVKIDTNGNIDTLSSTIYLRDNEVLGTITKDIKLTLSKVNDKIEGIALSKEYYGFIEIEKARISGEVFIKNLLEEASQVEEFRNISKLKTMIPEINDIAEEILEETFINFEITPQDTKILVDSKNLKSEIKLSPNHQKIYTSYTPSPNKNLYIFLLEDTLEIKAKNFSFYDEKLDLNLSIKLTDHLLINKSFIKTKYITGNIFDNLRLQNNVITISNKFLYGKINLNTINGKITLEPKFTESILKSIIPIKLDLEIPKLTLNITSNHSLIYGVNENFEINIKSISNTLEINKLILKNQEISANGKIYFIKDSAEGTISLRYKDIRDNISVFYTPKTIQITSPKYGNVRIFPKTFLILLNLNNITIGETQFRKISGFISNGNIKADCIVSLYDISANLELQGTISNLKIPKGYVYTRNKAIEVSGNIKIDSQNIEANLLLDKSQISFQTKDLSTLYLSGTLNNLPLTTGIVKSISGTIRAKINLSESNIINVFEESFSDLDIQTEGIFRKIKIYLVKQKNNIRLNSQIFNYFNIFFVNLTSDNQNNISGQVLSKNRLIPQSKIQSLLNISGKLYNNTFEGKIKVSIDDFSNLNENWEKNITISPEAINMYSYGNGLNLHYSKENITISYVKDRKILYEIRGTIKDNKITGEISGKIPLEFLLVPDFLERLDGKIEFENNKFTIIDNKINIYGKVYISANSLKISLINETFQIPKTPIEIQNSKISFKSLRVISTSKEIIADGIADFMILDNPILDIKLSQTKGTISLKIDLGDLKLEGDAIAPYLNIIGSISFPTIQGKIKLLKNSRVEYILFRVNQQNEFWGYNFAQISEWKLEMEFDNSQFISQILEGKIEKGNLEIKGSIMRNNLSLKGYANLNSGTLKYLGKNFSVDSLQLVFQGNDMDFIPFVNGTLHTFAYDNKTQDNIKIIMDVSGKLTKLKSSFRSEPERTQSEIALILGIPYEFGTTVRQGVSLVGDIGIYEFLSYNIRRYTGLDVFSLRSPIISTYLNSIVEGRYYLTTRELIKGTEILVGKQITPNLLLQYKLSLDVSGDENSLTNILLHNFILGLNIYNFLLELQYSSSIIENQVQFEPKVNIRYNTRF